MVVYCVFFFFKQKTAYEMRISDWSSDVCSSDLIFAFLIAVAFVAGTVDAMAGGGGLLTIPALMAAGVPPVAALATNKLQSTIGTGSAFLTFWRAGHVDLRRFAWPAAGAFAGPVLGDRKRTRLNSSH